MHGGYRNYVICGRYCLVGYAKVLKKVFAQPPFKVWGGGIVAEKEVAVQLPLCLLPVYVGFSARSQLSVD